MSLKIEFRFAVLSTLLMLLWLAIEFVSGLQDEYIALHPYVTILAGVIIPLFTYRMALSEKIKANGELTFKQGLISGTVLTLFTALLALPVQLIFITLINPGIFESMIQYAVKSGRQTPEAAALFFNRQTYLIESVLSTLALGFIVTLFLARQMRTTK